MKLVRGTKNIFWFKDSRGMRLPFHKIFADNRRAKRIEEAIKKYGEVSLICAGSCGDEDGDINIQGFYRNEEQFFEIFKLSQVESRPLGKWEWSWRGLVLTKEDAEMLAKYGVAI